MVKMPKIHLGKGKAAPEEATEAVENPESRGVH
jgi:hypothetical protein